MRYTWDEAKRAANLRDHGIGFVHAEKVFAGLTLTYEDDRFPYGAQIGHPRITFGDTRFHRAHGGRRHYPRDLITENH